MIINVKILVPPVLLSFIALCNDRKARRNCNPGAGRSFAYILWCSYGGGLCPPTGFGTGFYSSTERSC